MVEDDVEDPEALEDAFSRQTPAERPRSVRDHRPDRFRTAGGSRNRGLLKRYVTAKSTAATASSATPVPAIPSIAGGIVSPLDVAQGAGIRMKPTATHISPRGNAQRSKVSAAMTRPPDGTWAEVETPLRHDRR
jgi:hypothetical protein